MENLEAAKKRLIYSLSQLAIPCITKWSSEKYGFVFDFIEDKRTNPTLNEEYVSTGYIDGDLITINLNEGPNFSSGTKKRRPIRFIERYLDILDTNLGTIFITL